MMDFLSLSYWQNSKIVSFTPILLAALFFLINLSGDHVFNKTNTLKIVLVAFSCIALLTLFFIQQKKIIGSYKDRFWTFSFLLILPLLVTTPGYYLSEGKYGYGLSLELTSQSLCIVWCFLIYAVFDSKSQIYTFWKFSSISIIYVCLIGFAEKVGFDPLLRLSLNPFESYWADEFVVYDGGQSRIESTFGNINYFAAWLIQLVPVFVALTVIITGKIYNKEKHRRRILFPVMNLLLLLTALAFTGTRSAIVCMLISLAFFMLVYFVRFSSVSITKAIAVITLLVIIIVGVTAVLNPTLVDRIYELLKFSSWESRLIPWLAAYESILQAPFFGYGLGSSYQLFFEFVQPDIGIYSAAASYNHVHFEWLEILQEGGLFGFLGYLFFWCLVFRFGIRFIKNKSNLESDQILMLGFLSGLLAYHLHGFFSVAPRMIIVRSMAYMLVAFVFILCFKNYKNESIKFKRWHNTPISSLLLALLLGCLMWIKPYAYEQYKFAKGLATESTNPNNLTSLALESENAYVLDKTSYLFAEQKNSVELKTVSERLDKIFPNYRDNLYFQAYAAYLNGYIEIALNKLIRHQNKDNYHEKTNQLLAAISLHINDEELFVEQLKIAVTKIVCGLDLIAPCFREAINSSTGNMSLPLQFTSSNSQFNIFIDQYFFSSMLTEFTQGKLNSSEAILVYAKSLAAAIGNSKFFIPSALMKDKNLQVLLGKYIQVKKILDEKKSDFRQGLDANYQSSLIEQIQSYKNEKLKFDREKAQAKKDMKDIEEALGLQLNLDDFMKKRALLNELTQWLVLTLMMSINAGNS